MTTEQQNTTVELAVFNLDSSREVTDLQMLATQIQHYLQACGQTSLQQVQANANVTTVANIFALTGSVLDLILYSMTPQTGEAAAQQQALLAANLIGLTLMPNSEAHARMALRPMLGLMAECLYRDNGKIRESDIKRMGLHLNAMIAGDVEQFLKETQAKLPALLSDAATLGTAILRTLLAPPSPVTVPSGSASASAEKRDPKLQFSNWAKPLIDLLATPSVTDLRPKIAVPVASTFTVKVTQAISTLGTALQQQANAGQTYTLAWLIQETLKAIQAQENKGSASVPINQTGEYQRQIQGDTLEFVSLQANALNDPSCATMTENSDSSTGQSISYAIGAERVKHTDFYISQLGFAFSRQYSSQMADYDDSMMGARWMMPFSNKIIPQAYGYLFIDSNGRKHRLPASIIEEDYQIPYENIDIYPLDNGDLQLSFGGDWDFYFHEFYEGQGYYLVQQHNAKSKDEITLNYLHIQQAAYLQSVDFKLQQGQHSLKFAYNDQVKIMAVFTDEHIAPLARYEYDTQGNLTKAYDQNGHVRHYEYNHAHQLTRYTDRTGRGQNIRYESELATAKAIEEWTDDGSFHTRLEWHERLRQVAVYNADNVPTYYYFDLDGFTYRVRLADGREKWTSRDAQKRITREIDFAGRETQQIYNEQGLLRHIIQPNGGMIQFAYDEQGNLTETKDPEGNIWKKEYDKQGNVSKETNPLGQSTQYKYNAQGQITEIIDAKGGTKKIQYNELGQMTRYSDCSGKNSTWEYTESGTLIAEQSATSQQVQYLYSQHGRDKGQLQSIIYPDGLKEQFEHDEEGRLLKHTDTTGKATHYHYNPVGLLQKRIDANQHHIGYDWDKQGRIIKLTNQNHAEYQFSYNPYGQLIREKEFDGTEKHYQYDQYGRLSQIRQAHLDTHIEYNEDGTIASKHYRNRQTGQQQSEHFDYNLKQQLSQVCNQHSQIDFYYNAVGQMIREHQHYRIPQLTPMTAVLRHAYDELGNLTRTIRPDGQEQSNLSYGSGHIYGIALNKREMVAFQRDDLHRETVRMLANGLVQSKNYNDMGLLISQQIQPEQETASSQTIAQTTAQPYQAHRHYQYDKNYLLSKVEDSRLGQLNYQYDHIGRLTHSQTPYQTDSYQFDPAGNLIDPKLAYSGTTMVNNNLIRSYQDKHYRYDERGNVTEIIQNHNSSLKLTWDNLNRLIQSEHNGKVTHYGYDVFGRRLYKHSPQQNQLTLFGWDGDLMIWESYRSDKKDSSQQDYTKHYVYEPDSFVPLLHTGYQGFIQLIATPDYEQYKTRPYSIYKDPVWNTDTRKKRTELERAVFYHCDQVGTPQTLTNEAGECIWEITQDTWGKSLEIKAKNQNNPFEQTHIRFQGQYYDEETGLHYNRYRYYEPHSARYMSKDPIGLNGGMNTSAYVADPNQWVDPMGLAGMWTNGKGQFADYKKGSDWYPSDSQAKVQQAQITQTANQQELAAHRMQEVKDWNVNYNQAAIASQKANEQYQKDMQNVQPIVFETPFQKKMKEVNQSILDGGERLANVKGPRSVAGARAKCAAGQCKSIELPFDYVYCSGGVGPLAYAEITNLHNGKVFQVGASSKPDVKGAKAIGHNAISVMDGSRKLGASDLSKLKSKFSASCMAGYIFNKPARQSDKDSTDQFLTGLATSASGGIWGVRAGVVLPIDTGSTAVSEKVKAYFTSNTMKGLEIGLGNPGADFNFGYGVEAQGRTITGTVREATSGIKNTVEEMNRIIKD